MRHPCEIRAWPRSAEPRPSGTSRRSARGERTRVLARRSATRQIRALPSGSPAPCPGVSPVSVDLVKDRPQARAILSWKVAGDDLEP